ncbi:MAG: hypothetical protein GYB68_02285 [Chloroflexi bacterium]|nr:hypothetical protein [Chloroflexota bacterium]
MFGGEFPISGITLCYGPLVLTILGFIAFAWLTDLDARRPYLREMDLRDDEERLGEDPAPRVIEQPIEAETPTGTKVVIRPPENA